jgi:hypothetical protein
MSSIAMLLAAALSTSSRVASANLRGALGETP